jgi:hypothetical protein
MHATAFIRDVRIHWQNTPNEIPDRPLWASLDRDGLRELIECLHLGLNRFRPGRFIAHPQPPLDGVSVELRGIEGFDNLDGSYTVMRGKASAVLSVTLPADFRKPARKSPLWKFFRTMRPEKLRDGRVRYVRPEMCRPGGDQVWRPVKLDDSFDVSSFDESVTRGKETLTESKTAGIVKCNTRGKSMATKKATKTGAYAIRFDPKWLEDKKQWAAHMGMSFSDYLIGAVNMRQQIEKLMLAGNADEFLKLAKESKKMLAGEL